MNLTLTPEEQSWLADDAPAGRAMAMRIVTRAAEFLGAEALVPITSAHIDGCLYHGDAGVHFAEKLVSGDAQAVVPATLNVGALDLSNPGRVRADEHFRTMARRQMDAYLALGCQPTWTCAPYQAGHRPALGDQVAWGESNAIAFVNSVLGARSERYGDLLDISCAIAGRVPYVGLHRTENRRARLIFDTGGLSDSLKALDAFYPVLGAIIGKAAGATIAVINGLPGALGDDALKAVGAAAASKGAVGLFHVAGVTPEAATLGDALQDSAPEATITITADGVRAARDDLSNATGDAVDCLALGSPHFSEAETRALAALADGRKFRIPVYVCTGRHIIDALEADGLRRDLEAQGVEFIVDTCVVVTPILKRMDGVLMTNSGKFAHYTLPNTGYGVIFGSLADCVRSALAGKVMREDAAWQ